jgi:AcrR family transcriptional regulator
MTSSRTKIDPRKQRTREELLAAFFKLVLSRRYHEIRIADILSGSGVSRSTFYEHFASKDELLCTSMEGAFQLLAGMLCGESSTGQIKDLLEHFWENRALARSLFQGAAYRSLRRKLIECIEGRLDGCARNRLKIPRRLVAHALADAMFSPIVAWLVGEASCDAGELAVALQRSTAASIDALLVAPSRST